MIKTGIIGVNGYAGGELLRLLAAHPEAEATVVASRSQAGQTVAQVFPSFSGTNWGELLISDVSSPALAECDLIFLAVPHGVAAELVPGFLEKDIKIIDLGADFRLKEPATYKDWYNLKHPQPALLKEAVYGLPELKRSEIKNARLIGNPGCYPTSILLGLAPLLAAELLDDNLIIIDSKSGISGAGRTAQSELHFPEADDNLRAYGLIRHRHIPEIEQEASLLAGKNVAISFTPHLIPVVRGIFSTINLSTRQKSSTQELTELYQEYYQGEPFVTVLSSPDLPQTKSVLYTNRCQLGIRYDERINRIIILSVIDNLMKGAAGQAIQNMNILYGLEETTGLNTPGIWP
ncbi:MAG TPA: N-acetyl-gamma-glutamyl-phosphate reductase [Firmicutes bacterium]|nr:N-acetyl-gamma-glutamyl-phosphate reductase [Bacillota bacterium]HBT17595.1 N-acetyl-gamma-glutamyl-phosphate reductase [Bacillota bacterium]